MCLIILAYRVHPGYPLVVAANRDEFYERPSEKAHFWSPGSKADKEGQLILGGKDVQAGGTWLGVGQRSFRFAAVTNYREAPRDIGPNRRSRGELVSEFLISETPAEVYMKEIQENGAFYEGFNLVVGDSTGLWYLSNRDVGGARKLEPGRIYGLCNRLLDDPWPKVERSKHSMSVVMEGMQNCSSDEKAIERLFQLLRETTKAPDEQLPRSEETGCSQELEKLFSSIFIESDWYGTRASTVLMIPAAASEPNKGVFCSFAERSFGMHGEFLGQVNEDFEIESVPP